MGSVEDKAEVEDDRVEEEDGTGAGMGTEEVAGGSGRADQTGSKDDARSDAMNAETGTGLVSSEMARKGCKGDKDEVGIGAAAGFWSSTTFRGGVSVGPSSPYRSTYKSKWRET